MDNVQITLQQILSNIPEESDKILADDTTLLAASSKEDFGCGEQYDRRDALYSDLLERYIAVYKSKATWNRWFKLCFFILAMSVFGGIVVTSLVALIIAATKANDSNVLSTIAITISSMAGIISSIIVLPKIIAEHLFPTNEDENMIDMVKNMQVNDSKIRAFYKDKK